MFSFFQLMGLFIPFILLVIIIFWCLTELNEIYKHIPLWVIVVMLIALMIYSITITNILS